MQVKRKTDSRMIFRRSLEISRQVGMVGIALRVPASSLRRQMKNELNFPPKLRVARSRLYRRRFLQVNTRWKALDEIYKIYILLHRSDLKISAKNRQHFFREWIIINKSPQTLRGSLSAVSTPIFARKCSLESSRRDLHNALLCTVL